MSDLVERLREQAGDGQMLWQQQYREAADEIEELQRENDVISEWLEKRLAEIKRDKGEITMRYGRGSTMCLSSGF